MKNHAPATLMIASLLYGAYCDSTGQKLPTFDDLVGSDEVPKQQVVDAWCDVALQASNLGLHIVAGQPCPTIAVEAPGDVEYVEKELARQAQVNEDKALRQRLDAAVEHLRASPFKSAERTLAMRSLQNARHWLGEDLGILREPYPYPKGNNTGTLAVDPAADKASK